MPALIQSFSIKKISQDEWVKHGSGDWQVLLSCYFGHQYTETLKETLGMQMGRTILITRNGYTSTNTEKEALTNFGNHLVDLVKKDKRIVARWCSELKKQADIVEHVIKELRKDPFGEEQFKTYVECLYPYVTPHQAIKQVVNYLPLPLLEEYMSHFQEARQYAEKAYEEARVYAYEFAEGFEKETKYPAKALLCLTEKEIADYFKTGKLISKKTLEERLKASAVLFEDGKYFVVSGPEVDAIENAMHSHEKKGEVSGTPAYPGTVTGIVKIVFKPEEGEKFNEGDILVSGNTRPFLLPVMAKSKAIVTEAGGLLSHAAIMAREYKKPTIVGAVGVTIIFKDGDLVEVDATKGVIRKISKR
jgi:phosphohistidine swiveling domain-containing protein